MKKRLLGILLVLSMLVSSVAILASCGKEDPTPAPSGVTNPEDAILTPIGPDNTSKVTATLTADTLTGVLDAFKGAYDEAPELDINELIKDVNLYGKYGETAVSVKDGYISTGNTVIGFKDGHALRVENGSVVEIEQIVDGATDEQVDAYYNMITEEIAAIIATGHLPEITSADLYRSAEWYFFTDSYISRLVKGAFYLIYEMESEQPITVMEKAQFDSMIDTYLDAIKIKIGFAAEGEAINGVLLSVKVKDIAALTDGMEDAPSGSVALRIEAKLAKDLKALNYVKESIDVDIKDMVEAEVDYSLVYANDKVTLNFEAEGESMGQGYEADVNATLAIGENGIPGELKVNTDVKVADVRLNTRSFHGDRDYYEIYAKGDLTVKANATLDLSKLAGSGKVLDAKVTLATSNVSLVAEGYRFDEQGNETPITSSEVLEQFDHAEQEEVKNVDEFNFTASAALTTEDGAGVASVTYAPKGAEAMTFELELAVNSDKAVAPSDEIKDLIANYDLSADPESPEPASPYRAYYEKASVLAQEGLILSELGAEDLADNGAVAAFSLSDRTGMSSLYAYEFATADEANACYEASQSLTSRGMKVMINGCVVIYGTEDLFTAITE